MTKRFITPDGQGESDAAAIQRAVDLAAANGCAVRIPRENPRTGRALWEIGESISLPSGCEILFDGAHLRLADGCFCSMFTAVGGRTCAQALTDIRLYGRNGADLDGGLHNGLTEKNSELDGRPHILQNTTLLFANVNGLCVEDLTLSHQRWWAITNVAVRNATFRRLHFNAHLARVDEDGVLHATEVPQHYREMYVHNADGIDLRVGCHDVLIEDITGFTGDDTVALTALGGFERRFGLLPEDACPDIHDVTVRRVCTETFYCATVRLLNHNGNKLYNVTVEDIEATRARVSKLSNAAVAVGDKNYARALSAPGDTYRITLRRIRAASERGVSLCRSLQDSVIEDVRCDGGIAAVAVRRGCEAQLTRCTLRHLGGENGALPFAPEGITLCACTVE